MSIAVRSAVGVWGSRTTFVLALTASAIGLGNFWRFSYLMGEHGGAPFLVVYLLSLFLVAVPVLIAEALIGSCGRRDPVSSVFQIVTRSGITRGWLVLPWLAGIAALFVLAYHCVVAGWGLAYLAKMDAGVFADASAVDIGQQFEQLLGDPQTLLRWQTLFIAAVFAVSALGAVRGLGVLFWFAGPLLLAAMGVLIEYSLVYGDMGRAQEFLFKTNLYTFTAESALIAMGQAFYTLGIGMGVGMAFGAYAPERIPLGRAVIAVAIFDTAVALAAGLIIFPLVFANNTQPAMGPGLIFIAMPYAFGNTADGELMGGVFFFMLSVLSLASAVALAEPIMAYLSERMRLKRPLAAVVLGLATWSLSLCCVLSFNIWQDVYWFGEKTVFEFLDFATSAVLLPVVALLTTLLVGYGVRREVLRVELYRESVYFIRLWRACLRYLVPPFIVFVMLMFLLESGNL